MASLQGLCDATMVSDRLQGAVVQGVRIVVQEYDLRLDKNDPVEEAESGRILICNFGVILS